MKINIAQISPEGLTVEETVASGKLDLDMDIIKFRSPVKIKADFQMITNTVTVDITVRASCMMTCSRCLEEFEVPLSKHFKLNYPLNKQERTLDLDPDIREEIVLDYPINPLCIQECKGLCPSCGKNLNKETCTCT